MKKMFILLAMFSIGLVSASDGGESNSGSESSAGSAYSAHVTLSYSQAILGGGGAKGTTVYGSDMENLAQKIATVHASNRLLIQGEDSESGSSTLRSILINDIEVNSSSFAKDVSDTLILPAGTGKKVDTDAEESGSQISAFVTCSYTQAVSTGVSAKGSLKQSPNMKALIGSAIKYCTDESLIKGEQSTMTGGKTLESILINGVEVSTNAFIADTPSTDLRGRPIGTLTPEEQRRQ